MTLITDEHLSQVYKHDLHKRLHVDILKLAKEHNYNWLMSYTHIKEEKPMLYEGYVISNYEVAGEEKIEYGPDQVLARDADSAKNIILTRAIKATTDFDPGEITVLVRPFSEGKKSKKSES